MGELLRKAVDERRKLLMKMLIHFSVYQKGDQQLHNMTLTEMEDEISRIK